MSGVPNVGHQTQGPRKQQTLSAWDPGRNRIGNICLFVYLGVRLIWAGDCFRNLQLHPFDLVFS